MMVETNAQVVLNAIMNKPSSSLFLGLAASLRQQSPAAIGYWQGSEKRGKELVLPVCGHVGEATGHCQSELQKGTAIE